MGNKPEFCSALALAGQDKAKFAPASSRGRLIKSRRDLITTVEVIPDFFLHNLVHSVSDDFAASIEKSGINY